MTQTSEYMANPCRFWVEGSETESFTYKPGAKPWFMHLSGHAHIKFNGLIFADDEQHAREIIVALCDFARACHRKYVEHEKECEKEYPNGGYSAWRLVRQNWHTQTDYKLLRLAAQGRTPERLEFHLIPAAMNQCFKVSWASNDNF